MTNPIKPELPKVAIDWLEFENPTNPDHKWRIHLNFLMSNWECMFGQGCQGHFGVQSATTDPDIGCCSHGAYITSKENFEHITNEVEMLTENELSKEGLAYIRKHGWFNMFDKNDDPEKWDEDVPGRAEDEMNGKTKVRDGGCVFANRSNESNGKIGCAFHHLGQRLGTPDHVDVMPTVCWQLPLGKHNLEDPETAQEITAIVPWDSVYWGGSDDDGEFDSWMSWWCVDTADAYNSKRMLYQTMEPELREMMGDESYVMMCNLIGQRINNAVSKMPGQLRNEGRPMLPLLVGNRTNRRA